MLGLWRVAYFFSLLLDYFWWQVARLNFWEGNQFNIFWRSCISMSFLFLQQLIYKVQSLVWHFRSTNFYQIFIYVFLHSLNFDNLIIFVPLFFNIFLNLFWTLDNCCFNLRLSLLICNFIKVSLLGCSLRIFLRHYLFSLSLTLNFVCFLLKMWI